MFKLGRDFVLIRMQIFSKLPNFDPTKPTGQLFSVANRLYWITRLYYHDYYTKLVKKLTRNSLDHVKTRKTRLNFVISDSRLRVVTVCWQNHFRQNRSIDCDRDMHDGNVWPLVIPPLAFVLFFVTVQRWLDVVTVARRKTDWLPRQWKTDSGSKDIARQSV